MPDALQPLRFVLLVFAGLVNRDSARNIAFQREENRVLRELLGASACPTTSAGVSPRRARRSAAGSSAKSPRSSPPTRSCGGTTA